MGRRLDERHVPVYDERRISNRDRLEPGMVLGRRSAMTCRRRFGHACRQPRLSSLRVLDTRFVSRVTLSQR
jgi:hypothetical protein